MNKLKNSFEEQLMDRLGFGSLVINENFEVAYANRWFTEQLNIDINTILTKDFFSIFDVPKPSVVKTKIQEVLTFGAFTSLSQMLHNYLIPVKLKNDIEFEYMQQNVLLSPIKHLDKTHCLITIQNVTSMVRRERLLRKKSQVLSQTDDNQKNLLYILKDQLKSPLGNIICFSDMMMEDFIDDDEEKSDAMKRIRWEAIHAESLLSVLLDWVDLENKSLQLQVEPVCFIELVDEILQEHYIRFKDKMVPLVYNREEVTYCDPYLCSVDRDKIVKLMRMIFYHVANLLAGEHSFSISLQASETHTFDVNLRLNGVQLTDEEYKRLMGQGFDATLHYKSEVGIAIIQQLLSVYKIDLDVNQHIQGIDFILRCPHRSIA